MRPLSILFTNNTLAMRAGSELWVRDVARALVARGHRPAAFSLVIGAIAGELRAATVPVVSDLSKFTDPPDLIHGHHHVETLIAALHFPGVPIVHFCHGWLPWEERPLKHPAIVRYVAVDDTCADRLIAEEGIPASQVERLLNFVDVDRFVPRAPLPPRPRRALVFSNQAREDGYAAVIREACREVNIDVETAGLSSGRVLDRPEVALKDFDLVFAKARAALEAMAVGCSVILADVFGAGPMVRAADLERMRAGNFGVRLLQRPHSVAWYREQIAAYDSADAACVSTRVRREAGLDTAVDRLLEIYARALGEDVRPARTPGDCLDGQRAAARHLASIAAELKHVQDVARHADYVARELAAVNALGAELSAQRHASELRVTALDAQLAAARREIDTLVRERQAVIDSYERLSIMRLRSALMRAPLVGPAARRTARWLAARVGR